MHAASVCKCDLRRSIRMCKAAAAQRKAQPAGSSELLGGGLWLGNVRPEAKSIARLGGRGALVPCTKHLNFSYVCHEPVLAT